MKPPYAGKIGSQEEKTLSSGVSTNYSFGLKVPLDDQTWADIIAFKTKNFYVLGWIGYSDDLGNYRTTGFCRRYDVAMSRLVKENDPDYEYAV